MRPPEFTGGNVGLNVVGLVALPQASMRAAGIHRRKQQAREKETGGSEVLQ